MVYLRVISKRQERPAFHLYLYDTRFTKPFNSEESSFLHSSLQPVVALVSAAPDPPCISSSRASLAPIPFNRRDLHVPIPSPWTREFVPFNLYQESTCCPICQTPWVPGNMWFGGLPLSWDLQVGVFSWKGHWEGRQC